MASYELRFKKSVVKDLRAFPKPDVKRILKRIQLLAENPRSASCEKLSGQERYRVRQGVYRIVYGIEDSRLTVFIVKIGHRRDVCNAIHPSDETRKGVSQATLVRHRR